MIGAMTKNPILSPDLTVATAHACVNWAGETLHLLPERALWWPAQRVLLLADLHIGKAAAYRALGQPVPGGTTQANLERLSTLVLRHQPEQVVFLGDLLHAASSRTPSVLDALHTWREQHARLVLTLVRGNHDSRAGDPPPSLGVDVVDEPWALGPFACCHHPQSHPERFVLAGHLHPVVSLQGLGRDRLRLPCFVSDADQAVLPAFGEFTGGFAMSAAPGRCFHALGGERVWALAQA
jgi:DNA ligase-associated metallophosphoesterase